MSQAAYPDQGRMVDALSGSGEVARAGSRGLVPDMTAFLNDPGAENALFDVVVASMENFLNQGQVQEQLKQMVRQRKRRFIIPLSSLTQVSAGRDGVSLANLVLEHPFAMLPPIESSLRSTVGTMMSSVDDETYTSARERRMIFEPNFGFSGWFGSHGVTPRGLSSVLANKLVCVQGIVTCVSDAYSKLTSSWFYDPSTGRGFAREHIDTQSFQRDRFLHGAPNIATRKDGDSSVELQLELGASSFKDMQRLTIQEMPEVAPTGQLPRSVDVFLEHDLVNSVRPGDRVNVYGLYRTTILKDQGFTMGLARTFVIANNIESIETDRHLQKHVAPSVGLMSTIRDLAKRENALSILAASIAPSIHGHEIIKRGLALQLIGGDRKVLDGDGSKLRGDIHILLIGDPSCGKSQLLRFMLNISPLAISTTGRGSSAVGLTAAVSSDPDTGERRVEAGAMVLADGGLVCIDEFDKMTHDDRAAIHEVMEQQTVSIAKAGIQTTLNARTTVLAAANPVYGSFDERVPLSTQISFPDSLLSRFDLICIVRDSDTPEKDQAIADQVLAQYRIPVSSNCLVPAGAIGAREKGRASGREQGRAEKGGAALTTILQPYNPTALAKSAGGGSSGFEPLDPEVGAPPPVWVPTCMAASEDARKPRAPKPKRAAASRKSTSGALVVAHGAISADDLKQRVLSVEFLRCWIRAAKNVPAPDISDEAADMIAAFYADIRQRFFNLANGGKGASTGGRSNFKAMSVPTVRCLEACIRLATAHARLKLRPVVLAADVEEARKLLLWFMCGDDQKEDAAENESADQSNTPSARKRSSRKRQNSDIMGCGVLLATPGTGGFQMLSRSPHPDSVDAPGGVSDQFTELSLGSEAKKKRRLAGGVGGKLHFDRESLGRGASVSLGSGAGKQTLTKRVGNEKVDQQLKQITAERVYALAEILSKIQNDYDETQWPVDKLTALVNKKFSAHAVYSDEEFSAGILQLQVENKLMKIRNLVFLV